MVHSRVKKAKPWQIGCFTRPWGRFRCTVVMHTFAEACLQYFGLMSTKPKGNPPWALVITADTSVEEATLAPGVVIHLAREAVKARLFVEELANTSRP